MGALGIGLVGCGAIGDIRARALARSGTCRLVSVADVDVARAQAAARRFNVAAEADWRALLDRADVDAVMISTPPSSHEEIGVAAVRAGKHVLCEKPLARSPSECLRLIEAAAQAGRFLATGFNYRFYPSVMKAREFFDAGAIGDLDHMRAYTGYSATAHNQPWLHELQAMGGGTLRDNGIHLIDTALYFFGDPVEVQGQGSTAVWNFPGCEDYGVALFTNARGNIGVLQSSWNEWSGYRFAIELYGTAGCIHIRCFPMITRVTFGDVKSDKRQRRSFYFPRVHVMEHLKTYRWIVEESFIREFDAFRAAVDGKPSAVATGHDGWRSVDLAYRACLNLPGAQHA